MATDEHISSLHLFRLLARVTWWNKLNHGRDAEKLKDFLTIIREVAISEMLAWCQTSDKSNSRLFRGAELVLPSADFKWLVNSHVLKASIPQPLPCPTHLRLMLITSGTMVSSIGTSFRWQTTVSCRRRKSVSSVMGRSNMPSVYTSGGRRRHQNLTLPMVLSSLLLMPQSEKALSSCQTKLESHHRRRGKS